MRSTPRLAIAAVLLALAALSMQPANARPDGCVAVGTHAVRPNNSNPWDCFYVASGLSNFTAATTNPFVIAVSRDDGQSWIELFRRPEPGAALSGRVDTQAGDLVSVSISCWSYAERRPCGDHNPLGGRDGVIWVQSQI